MDVAPEGDELVGVGADGVQGVVEGIGLGLGGG